MRLSKRVADLIDAQSVELRSAAADPQVISMIAGRVHSNIPLWLRILVGRRRIERAVQIAAARLKGEVYTR